MTDSLFAAIVENVVEGMLRWAIGCGALMFLLGSALAGTVVWWVMK